MVNRDERNLEVESPLPTNEIKRGPMHVRTALFACMLDSYTYRSVRTTRGTNNKEYIDTLVGGRAQSTKLSQDVLKTRAELLFDVRALVQLMYKDISEISSMVVEL